MVVDRPSKGLEYAPADDSYLDRTWLDQGSQAAWSAWTLDSLGGRPGTRPTEAAEGEWAKLGRPAVPARIDDPERNLTTGG